MHIYIHTQNNKEETRPRSTVTWGPSLSLTATSPSFPSPFSPLPQPSPSLVTRSGPQIQLRGPGSIPPAEIEFGAF